jgi:Na+-translocating ferredoxin:NAD+ oxidoreductase RnfA subunit
VKSWNHRGAKYYRFAALFFPVVTLICKEAGVVLLFSHMICCDGVGKFFYQHMFYSVGTTPGYYQMLLLFISNRPAGCTDIYEKIVRLTIAS